MRPDPHGAPEAGVAGSKQAKALGPGRRRSDPGFTGCQPSQRTPLCTPPGPLEPWSPGLSQAWQLAPLGAEAKNESTMPTTQSGFAHGGSRSGLLMERRTEEGSVDLSTG